jgi:hypothetical protein
MMWLIGWIPLQYRLIAILAVLVVTHAAAFGTGWKWRDYQAKADQLQIEKEHNRIMAAKHKRVIAMTNDIRAAERRGFAALQTTRDKYERKMSDERAKTAVAIADLRAGLFRLRDPGGPSIRAGGGITTTTGTAAGEVRGNCEAGLSGQAAEFLLGEAGRANGLVIELNECRETALKQNRQCNELLGVQR